MQESVNDSMWIASSNVLIYTSYQEPSLALVGEDGRRKPLATDRGAGIVALSGDGRRLLWNSVRNLHLFELPSERTKLLNPAGWRKITTVPISVDAAVGQVALSHDGRLAAAVYSRYSQLRILEMETGRSVLYDVPDWSIGHLEWSADRKYIICNLVPSNAEPVPVIGAIPVDESYLKQDTRKPATSIPAKVYKILQLPAETHSMTWR